MRVRHEKWEITRVVEPTCEVRRRHCKHGTRQNEENQENPVRIEDSLTANNSGYVVPHRYDEVVENELQRRNGEENEGLDQALPSLFFARKPTGSEEGYLVGDILHDCTNRSRVQSFQRNPQNELYVAPPVPFGPAGDVVGGPDKGVDGVEEIEKRHGDDHAGAGQLAVLVEESQRDPAARSCAQVKQNSEEYVGRGAR